MVKDFRNNADFNYKYYRRQEFSGQVDTPIRMVLNQKGQRVATDTIDPQSASLVQGIFLGEIMKGEWIEESTEQEFYALCEQKIAETKSQPEPGGMR